VKQTTSLSLENRFNRYDRTNLPGWWATTTSKQK